MRPLAACPSQAILPLRPFAFIAFLSTIYLDAQTDDWQPKPWPSGKDPKGAAALV
jgi:hypothetical protein